MNDCFERDWTNMKILKVKSSLESDVKEKMRSIYPMIRQIYRRLAATGLAGSTFGIGWNVYREFITQTLKLADHQTLKPEDCDRLFIAVNVNKGGAQTTSNEFNSEKSLVRHEFLEILLRIAVKKYFESEKVNSETAAIAKFTSENLEPYY